MNFDWNAMRARLDDDTPPPEAGTIKCSHCKRDFYPGVDDYAEPILCRVCSSSKRKCEICSKEFIHPLNINYCSQECDRELSLRERQAQIKKWWSEFVPRDFQDTKLDQLPNQAASQRVLDWKYGVEEKENGTKGLFLKGNTGLAKSRTVYFALRPIAYEEWTVKAISGRGFQNEVVERTRPDGKGGFEKWFNGLAHCDVLFFDEPDKMKFTDRVQSEFFELVKVRCDERRPIIFASNAMPDYFATKMDPNYGPAMVRRVQQFCVLIDFDKQ